MAASLTVAIRLSGGLGDHILGMRVLPFVASRYPSHSISVFSDASGHTSPLVALSMSPFVADAVPVLRRSDAVPVTQQELETIRHEDLARMLSADIFIDGAGSLMFTNASQLLDIPAHTILAHRTELTPAPEAVRAADRFLGGHPLETFVGINLTKYGTALLTRHWGLLTTIVKRVLATPHATVLNFFESRHDFPHLPTALRDRRREITRDEAHLLRTLEALSPRVLSCVDLPLPTVAGLLTRCRYFIGVDNGIKHLAWALGVPLTYLHPEEPKMYHILRWMPDYNRLLHFDCLTRQLEVHLERMDSALTDARSAAGLQP